MLTRVPKQPKPAPPKEARSLSAMTLVELMVGIGLAGLLLLVVVTLFLFGLRSFAGLGNYASLSGQSRMGLDRMSQELREAGAVLAANTNLPVRSLTLSNAVDRTIVTFTWDSGSGVLYCDKTGQPTQTNLTGCNDWSFQLFQRNPGKNWEFYPARDNASCKLVSMSWTCFRSVMGQKANTEDSLSAQFVLRGKR
jgi:hypothetical protein